MNAPFGSGIAIPWVEDTIPVKLPQRDIWNEVYKVIRAGRGIPHYGGAGRAGHEGHR